VYSAQARRASLRARKNRLDLTWSADGQTERAYGAPMDADDSRELQAELARYPGLRVAAGFQPEKTVLEVVAGKHRPMRLVLYSIWPKAAPHRASADPGHIRFLGEDDTYTFSEPMMLAHGTLDGREMRGLMFLDRQWGKHYFGTRVYVGFLNMLRFGRALRYSHTWLAFQAYNPRTQEWSFFHIWNQFERADNRPDRLTGYSGLAWMSNGETTGQVGMDGFRLVGSGFVKHGDRDILLDYANGRAAYFPSRITVRARDSALGDFRADLRANPAKQFLTQPIYLYEGYATGKARWNGDELEIRGRLESSRILFRQQDYREMLASLGSQPREWAQPRLQDRLRSDLSSPWGDVLPPVCWLFREIAALGILTNDLDVKLAVFGKFLSHAATTTDRDDPEVTIYR
jgi:hypothetical protein